MSDSYELEIDVDAPRTRVWQALTDPRRLEQWFCEHANVDLDAGHYDFWGRYTQGNPPRRRHEVLAVEDEKLLRFAFPYMDADTTVEITLDGDTRVHVQHTGVPPIPPGAQAHPRHLWSSTLEHLRGWIERGTPGPRFDYSWRRVGGFEIHADVPAPPEQVFPALVAGWDNPEFKRPARNEDEDFHWGELAGIKVLDIVPDQRYELAWIDDQTTVLTHTLEGSGGRTRVTLVHSGFGEGVDETGVAEGFFSGLVKLFWVFESGGTWPPPITERLQTPFPQSGWEFGVRVLQSGSSTH